MARESIKREILRLVARRDGECGWYHGEHFLSSKETGPFFAEIDALVKEGMMDVRPNPKLDHHERYWITEKGRRTVAAWDDA
jgi:hypothetical protein